MLRMTRRPLPSPEKLTIAVAKDFPGAEVLVSFPERWQLVHRFQPAQAPRYVAGFPLSYEKSSSHQFPGLQPEINRSLTIYRLYRLFEPWPIPLLRVVWDGVRNEGRVLDACRLRVHLQPVGQAQIWKGPSAGVLWECYTFDNRQRRPDWQEELATFWQVVERDMGVNRIFTQPHEPSFEEGYTEFLSHLGYAPDPVFEHWWSKTG
jgi:hypothetical protein